MCRLGVGRNNLCAEKTYALIYHSQKKADSLTGWIHWLNFLSWSTFCSSCLLVEAFLQHGCCGNVALGLPANAHPSGDAFSAYAKP